MLTGTPTLKDRLSFLDRQRAGTDLPVPTLGGNSSFPQDDAAGVSKFTDILAAFARAIGKAVTVELDGYNVTVNPPRVKHVRGLLQKILPIAKDLTKLPEAMQAVQVMEHGKDILLTCISFDAEPERKATEEWFDDLTLAEAARITQAFGEVFNVKGLFESAKAVAGNPQTAAK